MHVHGAVARRSHREPSTPPRAHSMGSLEAWGKDAMGDLGSVGSRTLACSQSFLTLALEVEQLKPRAASSVVLSFTGSSLLLWLFSSCDEQGLLF